MDFLHSNLCVVIVILLFLNTSNVQGRYHYHKKQKPKEAPVLPSPVSQSPPPVPSDPNTDPPPVSQEPNDPGNLTSNCIFDVVSFGAGCLDKAAVQTETDYAMNAVNPWRLYTVTQVEELKAIIRLLPVWASRIVFATVYSQMSTMFVLQGNTLEKHIGPNFKIPSASLSLFDTLSVLFWAPVYDSFLIPLAKSLLAMKEASLSSKEWALVLLSL